jgi:hypothetical protein
VTESKSEVPGQIVVTLFVVEITGLNKVITKFAEVEVHVPFVTVTE